MSDKYLYTIREAEQKLAFKHLVLTFLSHFILYFMFVNIMAGVFVLVVRQMEKPLYVGTILYYILLFFAVVYALYFSFKHKISNHKWLAVIDDCNEAGGVIVSSAETGDDSWIDENKKLYKLPELVYKNKINKYIVIFSFVFFISCFFIPFSNSKKIDKRLSFKEITLKDTEKIKTLREIEAISEKEALQMQQILDNISNNAEKNGVNRTLEALDKFRDNTNRTVGEAVAKMVNEKNFLNKLQQLIDSGSGLDYKNSDLKKIMKEAEIEEPEAVTNKQKAEEELKNYIEERNKKINSKIEKLVKNQLIQKELGAAIAEPKTNNTNNNSFEKNETGIKRQNTNIENSNSNNNGETSEKMKENGFVVDNKKDGKNEKESENVQKQPVNSDGSGKEEETSQMNSGFGGSEGHTEGGKESPLNFNRKTSTHDVGYKDYEAQKTGIIDINNLSPAGICISAPTENNANSTKKSYNIIDITNKLKTTHYDRETILPRHRNAVIKYFGNNGAN